MINARMLHYIKFMFRCLIGSDGTLFNYNYHVKALIFFVFVLLHFTLVNAQKFTIQDIPLYWSDFNLTSRPASNGFVARISTSLSRNYSRSKDDDNVILLNVILSINKKASCADYVFLDMEPDSSKNALLNHEKGHLIIALLHFRKMIDSLSKRHFSVRYKLEADSVMKALWNEDGAMSAFYDNDTNHGIITKRQLAWEKSLMIQFNNLCATDDKIAFEAQIKLQID